ncbi:MAG: hypothetical protein H7644_08845 [Candidatus Heimdallarchaeota archaeon]|nr:hypothetical protein [Candidatus Heimdallarchaeota archaeon]MCK5143861.1 hypothetical protein [Candidatus Heimdallarchaeota archaeon]
MNKRLKQVIVLSSVFLLYLAVFLVFILGDRFDVMYDFVRILALFGLLTLFVSSIMTAFTKEIFQLFGKPFKKVHHIVAYFGLSLIILHPVFLVIYTKMPEFLIPRFDSWIVFWTFAGIPALYLIILASIAGLLQPRIKKWWRYVHGLNYIALLFGVIHGMLLGTDLSTSIFLRIFYVSLLVLASAAFVYKRYKSIRRKKQRKE